MAVRAKKTNISARRIRPNRASTAQVVIAETNQNDKLGLLTSALDQSDFWRHLEQARRRARISSRLFQVLIKPDLELFNPGDATGTDPELVEHLIDLLHDQGYTQVAVGDALSVWDLWMENRDVSVLAELVGYHYVTPKGRSYDVLGLSDDVVSVGFPADSVLHGSRLGRAWVQAGYRISFAKNKTHEEFGFALCLQNLLGVLPLRDKEYHYRHRLKPWDVCLEVHRETPAHFNLIDAFVSNHGSEGPRAHHPLDTRTLIASPNALLADWAASLKMNLDPFASSINAKALREIGLPLRYEIVGDLTPYPGWINVPPLLVDSVRKRNESSSLSRFIKPWLQSVNRDLFPFKDVVNDRINMVATRYLSNIDTNDAGFYTLVALNYLLAFAGRSLEAYQISYNKDRLRWKEAPLDFDTARYGPSDYEAVVDYMVPLERIIRQTPPEPNGLRWRYLDGSVLFEFSHLTQVPFEKFVARVDIAKAVQSMNDYIGGACVPIACNRAGRVIYQAERNVYLPQPNWIACFGGDFIDVGKLEYIEYRRNAHRIFWRTIRSSNKSAEFDDGIVTFAAETGDQTRVTIVARQKFTLPLFWQAVNIDLAPRIKDFLVVDAYTRYFRQTISNFEAQYQGRKFRVGRPWDPTEGESDANSDRQMQAIMEMVSNVGLALRHNFGDLSSVLRTFGISLAMARAPAFSVDEEGFRHFDRGIGHPEPTRDSFDLARFFRNTRTEAATFFNDLADAMGKDLALELSPNDTKGWSIS